MIKKNKQETKVDKKQRTTRTDETKTYNEKMDFGYLSKRGIKVFSLIGRGGFGVVYKAKMGDKCVAVKINFDTISLDSQFSEMGILKIVKGAQNITQLIDIMEINGTIHIVTEFTDHDHFMKYMKDMTPIDIKWYMHSLLIGLYQLKKRGIIHRDLKPSNFLYNFQKREGKIIDFGVSTVDEEFFYNIEIIKPNQRRYSLYKKLFQNQLKNGCKFGTNSYSSLQVLLKKPQSFAIDIWSTGVIFFQLLVKKFTIFRDFLAKNNLITSKSFICSFLMQLALIFGQQVSKACQHYNYQVNFPFQPKKVPFNRIVNQQIHGPECIDLLTRMLTLLPQKRITVQQALAHNYFKDMH